MQISLSSRNDIIPFAEIFLIWLKKASSAWLWKIETGWFEPKTQKHEFI